MNNSDVSIKLDKIRNMNDEELKKYLKNLTEKKPICLKCGKLRPNYTININNKSAAQHKKLFSLCDKCYSEFLEQMGIQDIDWD